MTQLLFANENIIFSAALAVMLIIAVLEGVATLIGLGVSEFLESLFPETDFDMDAPDIESGHSLSRFLGWLRVGEVPILMLFVVLLTAFGLIGLSLQSMLSGLTGAMLPGYIIAIPALFIALPVVRTCAGILAKVMPKDETEAVSADSFIGRIATITLGQAKQGSAAEAKLIDQYGHTHYIMLEPDGNESFAAGEELLLVAQRDSIFLAIHNTNQALRKEK